MTQTDLSFTPKDDSTWKTSYWFVGMVALCIGLLSIASSLLVDWMVHHVVRPLYASDLLEGLAAAVLSGFVLFRMQMRKRELLHRMQIVETSTIM